MVELMMSSGMASFPVKFELEDPLEDEHGPLSKRSKTTSASSNFNQVFFCPFLIFFHWIGSVCC